MTDLIQVHKISKQYERRKTLQAQAMSLREIVTRKIKNFPKSLHGEKNESFYALRDVSFSLARGEVLGIIGRNGAGKSTLLKILSRITTPTTGQATIYGRVCSLLEVGTGFHSELTGRENIYLNAAILGLTKHEIDQRLEEIIDFSGVREFIDMPIKRYSSGMAVRLAFSIAAHVDSDLLILDEVLAVGDTNFQKKCLSKINTMRKDASRSIILVSHNLSSIRKLCTKALVLDNGVTSGIVSPDEAISNYLATLSSIRSNNSRIYLDNWPDREHDNENRFRFAWCEFVDLPVPFYVADKLSLRFAITCSTAVAKEELLAAVQITNENGLNLINAVTDDSDFSLTISGNEAIFSVTFAKLSLYPDTYYISLRLGETAQNPIDYVKNCLAFEISQGGPFLQRKLSTTDGLIAVKPTWSSTND